MYQYIIFAVAILVAAGQDNDWTSETSIEAVSQIGGTMNNIKDQISVSGQGNIMEMVEQEISKFRQELVQSQGKLVQEAKHEIKQLNKKLKRQQSIITKQGLELDSQEKEVKELKISVKKQKEQIRIMQKQNLIMKRALIELKMSSPVNSIFEESNMPDNKDNVKEVSKDPIKINSPKNVQPKVSSKISSRVRRAGLQGLYNGTGIAFSAYLSHTVFHMAIGHTIKCDKVLINDGNAYSPFTGTFTAPESGVYFLTFHIDAYIPNDETIVKLVVNNRNIVDADAQSKGVGYHSASGNSAVIQLNSGEQVWLEIYSNNNVQLASSETYRFTSFAGFMLY